MQIPEKYKENFDVWSEGLPAKRQNSPYIFQVVASQPTKACMLLLALPTLAKTVQDYIVVKLHAVKVF
jgi:hypothetical protein